ncbi:sarcosine oxidase subunit gamma [Saccharopolyspora sp. NFXS83]|uniref:sarcosine oxidase subunit gamma n=1 Tax=Saccharopolyspora sp. NFXS83 TaxID=2993560 RepID=UPI00224B37EF|nr:sarcosine oxidase subunit gamma family protein [Saccharopolyspora sp. NFXS83]MCX2730217.1 sarcosine oxidase subunit gamma [Saccharopolyspora sp. NFXS83]
MAEPYGDSPLTSRADLLDRHSVPGAVRISEIPFRAQIGLRMDPKGAAAERIGTAIGAMPPNLPGTAVRAGELLALWLGPDEWLLVGGEGAAESVQDTLATALAEDHGSVVDLSANRTILEVSGPKAREVLNKGCALDLHPRVFGADRCAQTLLARAGVILVCRDAEQPSFWLLVRSSFARYVADWLIDASAEYAS